MLGLHISVSQKAPKRSDPNESINSCLCLSFLQTYKIFLPRGSAQLSSALPTLIHWDDAYGCYTLYRSAFDPEDS